MRRVLPLGLLALLLASCDAFAVTEIVLVVDTDVDAIDAFEVDAEYPNGETASAAADLTAQPAPRTLAFRHRGGDLGPLMLTVTGLAGGADRVVVERRVAFIEGRSVELRVHLAAGCEGATCGAGEACGNDGACRSVDVDACELLPGGCAPDAGDGTVDAGPLPDAGPMVDAGPCPVISICGVSAESMVGDIAAPRPCGSFDGAWAGAVEGPGVVSLPDGAYGLSAPGAHMAVVTVPDVCEVRFPISTYGPTRITDGAPSGELRDIAPDLRWGFVATAEGAYVVRLDGTPRWQELAGFTDLASLPAATAWAETLRFDGGFPVVLFVGEGPVDDWYAVRPTHPTLGAWELDTVDVPNGRTVTGVGVEVGRRDRAWMAASNDTRTYRVQMDGDRTYDRQDLGGDAARDWVALGASERVGRGVAFAGTGTEVYNLPDSAEAMAGGAAMASPVGVVRAGVLYDGASAPETLWLCGDDGVSAHPLEDVTAATTDLPPGHMWPTPCVDIAGDPADGTAWAALASGDVVRLYPDGVDVPILQAGPTPRYHADAVAVWSEGTRTRLWLVDRAAQTVVTYASFAP